MDKETLDRPSHDPLPIEQCPKCKYESPYHAKVGYIVYEEWNAGVYHCANETCDRIFEGEIYADIP